MALGALIASPLLAFRFWCSVQRFFVVVVLVVLNLRCRAKILRILVLHALLMFQRISYTKLCRHVGRCTLFIHISRTMLNHAPIRIARTNQICVCKFLHHIRGLPLKLGIWLRFLIWIYDIIVRLVSPLWPQNEMNLNLTIQMYICVWCVVWFGFLFIANVRCSMFPFIFFMIIIIECMAGPVKMGPFLFYCHLNDGMV